MLMSPVGLLSEKGCTGDAQQKIENYRPDFSSESAPNTNKPETVKKNNQRENGKNRSVPDGCLTPRWIGRQTVGRNITLTLTLFDRCYCVRLTL
jgi:hypothetical protein